MTQTPAGWYDDPYTAYGPPSLRWWDGESWTEHQAPHPEAAYPAGRRTTTPDGVELAGWGRRLAGFLIDGLIVTIAACVVGFPFLREIVQSYGHVFQQSFDASQAGRQPPGPYPTFGDSLGPATAFAAISLGLNFLYTVLFLRWKSATPAKLLLGTRVRLRETPGQLSWVVVLKRWLAQDGVGLLGLIPFVGTFGSLYQLVDGLWPLWDDRRQAVHDKFAGTNVVRVR